MSFTEQIRAQISAALDRSKLSQQSLAELTGIPSSTIQRKLTPGAAAFDTDQFAAIASALHLDIVEVTRIAAMNSQAVNAA